MLITVVMLKEDWSQKEPTRGITGSVLLRYEKKLESYFALVCLGCCIVIYRRIILVYALIQTGSGIR